MEFLNYATFALVKDMTITNLRFLNLRAASIRLRCDATQSRTYAPTYQSCLLLPFYGMQRQTGPPKRRYLPTRIHGISSIKTSTLKTIFVMTFITKEIATIKLGYLPPHTTQHTEHTPARPHNTSITVKNYCCSCMRK